MYATGASGTQKGNRLRCLLYITMDCSKLIKESTKEEIDAHDDMNTLPVLATYKGNREIAEQLMSGQANPIKTKF